MNNSILKYIGMAGQMGAIIGLFTFAGYKLDAHFNLKTPVCTIILSLSGVGLALYLVMRDFMKPDKP